MDQRAQRNPSLLATLLRLIEAGQRLAIDRVDLASLELRTLVRMTAFFVLITLAATIAWLAIMVAGVVGLQPLLPVWVTLPGEAGLNVGLALVIARVGLPREAPTPKMAEREVTTSREVIAT